MVSDRIGYAIIGRDVVETVNGAHWVARFVAPEDLGFVDAVDSAHAWAVGTHALFATDDGGSHWDVRSASAELTTVHFTDASHGWAVQGHALVRTGDGGRTWVRVDTPCPVDRTCFGGAQHGWVASTGAVYETADGGARWTRAVTVHGPDGIGGTAADLQCSSGGTAWVLFAGYGAAAGSSPYIGYRCASGSTCEPVVKPSYFPPAVPGLDGPGSYPGPFSVIDDHTAVFVGNTPPADQPVTMILLTDDGHGRGPLLTVPDGAPQHAAARSVSFTNVNRGWIVDSISSGGFHLIATTNRGKTWTVQYSVPAP